MLFDQLYADHRQIVHTVNKLIRMIDPENPAPIAEISEVRGELAAISDAHLAREQKLVAKILGDSDDYVARTIGKRYASGLVDLQLSLNTHTGKWNAAHVKADPKGYRISVREQFALAVKRIEWEERIVFPLMQHVRATTKDAIAPVFAAACM